jgi:hypothetical protein
MSKVDMQTQEMRGNNGQPAWITPELPPQYGELARQIADLQKEARKFEDIAAVVWQTGRPLTQAVRDLFAALQFDAKVMDGESTSDVRVDLDSGKRLLVQVAGGGTSIQRKSPQIARILQALQDDAGEKDRVILAANVFSELPLPQRREEPVAVDALRIIQGLGANFITTGTLFGLWRYSLTDLEGARKSIFKLHAQDGGIFR